MYEQPIEIFEEETIVYATFWERFAAAFIDSIIIAVAATIIEVVIDSIASEKHDFLIFLGDWGNTIYSIIIGIIYYAFLNSSSKQATWGKQALKIKVIDINGERITLYKGVVRAISEYLSFIILFIGYFMMLWDDKKQTLHDKIASTLVVKTK